MSGVKVQSILKAGRKKKSASRELIFTDVTIGGNQHNYIQNYLNTLCS